MLAALGVDMRQVVVWVALAGCAEPALLEGEAHPPIEGGDGLEAAGHPGDGPRRSERLKGMVDASGALLWTVGGEVRLHLAAFGTESELVAPEVRSVRVETVGGVERTLLESDQLVEWWEDRGESLEQGFDVAAPPPGEGRLRFEIEVEGATVGGGGPTITFMLPSGVTLAYTGLAARDVDGALLRSFMSTTPTGLAIEVDTAEAAWPVTVDPLIVASDLVVDGPSGVGQSVSTLDANGDGYQDLLVGGHYATGTAELYLGGPTGLSGVSAWSSGTFPLAFDAAAGVGDLNADGYDDLAVFGWSATNWIVRVFHGSATGPQATPARVLTGRGIENNFDGALAGAGDVNGDGYDDLLLGQMNRDGVAQWEGVVELYAGGPNGIGAAPAWSRSGGAYQAYLGRSVAGVGDVNGDGFDDFVAGGAFYNGGLAGAAGSHVLLWLGSATGPNNHLRSWNGLAGGAVGDVDQDGYDDVALTDANALDLYRGGPGGPGPSRFSTLASVGDSVAGGLDVGGDGVPDAVTGDPRYDGSAGRAVVVYGSAGGLVQFAHQVAHELGPWSPDDCGHAVVSGDWDGDGLGDVAVGCPLGANPRFEIRYGSFDTDGDGDPDVTDCGDTDPTVNRGAVERWYDGVDQNCDGRDDFDVDGDGQQSAAYGGQDCDDSYAAHAGCLALGGTCGGAMTLHADGLTPSSPVCVVVGDATSGGALPRRNPCAPGSRPTTDLRNFSRVFLTSADANGALDLAGIAGALTCTDSVQVLDLATSRRTPVADIP
ncbi:MAG: FG-GAP repeat protein [Alphaproteobacteria bacterium]|nr:FG-GAP repeat protein [Alphaproteobacteria bacterium]